MRRAVALIVLSLLACRGRNGRNGTNGMAGAPGTQGPPGFVGSAPFMFEGSMLFPITQVTQTVPGLNMERGDVLNVYLRWHGQTPLVWSQIGSTWIGGMIGTYFVDGNQVTIQTSADVTTDWLISGFENL